MKQRLVFILLFLLSASIAVQAQVTIGSDKAPSQAALLDLKTQENVSGGVTSTTGGLLLPRVELQSINSLAPFIPGGGSTADKNTNTGLVVYNLTEDTTFSPGLYTWDGTKWVSNSSSPEWFYMPSFELPVTTIGTQTFNLYEEYKKQFTKSGNAQFVSSSGTAVTVRPVYLPNQLDYFVTAYPTDVLTVNSIDANGVMSYDVLTIDIPAGSFINVIFVVKTPGL